MTYNEEYIDKSIDVHLLMKFNSWEDIGYI